MTDNSRPQTQSTSGSGGDRPTSGDNQAQRPRKKRRRGRRPASNQGNAQGGNQESNQNKKQSAEPNSGKPASGEGTQKRSRRRRRRKSTGAAGATAPQAQGTESSQKSGQKSGQKSAQSNRKRGGSQRNSNRNRRPANSPQQRRQQQASSRMETRDETSAGGLVVSGMAEAVAADGSVDLSRIYVALIGRLDRRGRLLWSMPKGHVEPGEHQWQTAEREVWEETGIYGEAFYSLGVIDYWFVSDNVRIHKTVHHNLLRYVDGVLNDEDPEVTEVTWVPVDELIEHLAYADERKLARQALDHMPELARKEHEAGRATPR
ncbi:NUDIX hydrolase [Corynebacterium breve]|uniref:NUDIX hydrolase n=1 Tax=Corynebacterium breve TaxID=3049799 RepID=A0ABY8VDU9_9CORY|nr:NUDIX hydrolase [Corynebacterium breve]WIM67678.1 NUDIX hydrolase [Corynebacterium breve]